jgi:DNA-binding NarL/FixJ family response regulator
MMNGWTLEQIALDMKMSKSAVVIATSHICRQEGVKNRRELAVKLGWKHEQPLNAWERHLARGRERAEMVEPLLLEGLSYADISRRTGMGLGSVKVAAVRIYKKHGLGKGEGKRGLGRKLGVELSRYGVNEADRSPASSG